MYGIVNREEIEWGGVQEDTRGGGVDVEGEVSAGRVVEWIDV